MSEGGEPAAGASSRPAEPDRGRSQLSRRRALQVGVAGVAGLGMAGCAGPESGHGTLAFALRGQLPRPQPTPTAALTPKPVAVRTRPVFTLSDYAASPAPAAIALTIDDGPSPHWTPIVLDLLRKYGVSASFCLIGHQVRRWPQLAARLVEEGHAVCNHTMTHPRGLGRQAAAAVEREIAGANEAILAATGVLPRAFRSPGGDWGPQVFAVAARHGLTPIDWSVDPMDWRRPGTPTITARLLAARPGQIILCHDGGGNRAETMAALDTVVPTLLRRGLKFVTL